MIHKTHLVLVSIFFIFIHIGNTQSNYLVELGNTETIKSTVLNEDRTYYVQLPQNFNENKKYPVVYVLDGGVLLNAVHIVHDYYYGGYMPEMIIIGVANAKNRTRDLTTSVVKNRRRGAFNYESGGASFNSGISCKLIDGNSGMFTAKQVEDAINPDAYYYSKTSLVEIENTTNKGGGACWHFD